MDRNDAPIGFSAECLTPEPFHQGSWKVSALALDVAGECNMACRYCAETATQPRRKPMTIEILEASWRFLFPDGHPDRGASIRLGSGEPLLGAALLRRLDDHIHATGGDAMDSRPAVFLTTNGTLVDETMEEWLISSGWHVKVSLDGPKEIHDKWRVTRDGGGTFNHASAVAERLARRMGERFSATAVLCFSTDPEAVFDEIASLGIRRIELVPAAHRDPTILPSSEDVECYERFVSNYARRVLKSREEDELPSLVRFERCVIRAMGYGNSWIPCGAGRSFLGVGPDGSLYPCFRFVGLESYCLGHLSKGLDEESVAAFQSGPGRSYDLRTTCRSCWAAPLCGGPCYSCSEFFGDGEPIPLHCAYTRADARAAVWLVQELQARDPKRLLSFLPGLSDLVRLA